MPSIHDLLHSNLHDVFGNRDAVTRREAIESTYSHDIVFGDPEGEVAGWDAVEEKAAGLLGGAPAEFVFVTDGPEYVGDGIGALAWAFGPAGAPVARGIDIITVTDGRISRLRTLLSE